jgi:hypothetical protein
LATDYDYNAMQEQADVVTPGPNNTGTLDTAYAYYGNGQVHTITAPGGQGPASAVTTYDYLCPCQLAGADFVRPVSRLGTQGTGRCNFAHSSMAA